MPVHGLMTRSTFERILDMYAEARSDSSLSRLEGWERGPRMTLAGGGEPTINPKLAEMIRDAVDRRFDIGLITNGSRMTDHMIEDVVAAGISSIAVSFWGIRREEYEAAMNLPYASTLRRVINLHAACHAAAIPFQIIWVRSPEIQSSDAEVTDFWNSHGITVDIDDTTAWNRGGLLPKTPNTEAPLGVLRPDPMRRIWCSDLYFSDSYRWNGDCVLCCCNFFNKEPISLGNIQELSYENLRQRKREILDRRPLPSMCRVCELPRERRLQWLAGPWLGPSTREHLYASAHLAAGRE